ncbi:hypothetical protein JTE90_008760 [Oedothorax gibbosus]|uniref:Triacylglycerol lipase n=1 Tax=Oedothorax gibbosus TaxID=931172 RepID=A0AAV6URH3_9ARAC|nr:hypothetical protein JTE90_008760 [Oedothorax gibbosus]
MMVCTKRLWGVLLLGIIGIGTCDALNALDIIYNVGDTVWKAFNHIVPDILNPLNLVYSNSCIEDLGCFYTGPPFFHPFERPLSFTPSNRIDEIDFMLFTQASPDEPYMLEPNLESLENSTFDATHKTIVLIHGFLVDFDFEDIRYVSRT